MLLCGYWTLFKPKYLHALVPWTELYILFRIKLNISYPFNILYSSVIFWYVELRLIWVIFFVFIASNKKAYNTIINVIYEGCMIQLVGFVLIGINRVSRTSIDLRFWRTKFFPDKKKSTFKICLYSPERQCWQKNLKPRYSYFCWYLYYPSKTVGLLIKYWKQNAPTTAAVAT